MTIEPTPELAAKLDADRREAAQAMTFEQRALGGVAMFDLLIDAMRGVLRVQHPNVNPAEIDQLIVNRLRIARQREIRK